MARNDPAASLHTLDSAAEMPVFLREVQEG